MCMLYFVNEDSWALKLNDASRKFHLKTLLGRLVAEWLGDALAKRSTTGSFVLTPRSRSRWATARAVSKTRLQGTWGIRIPYPKHYYKPL